MPLSFAGEYLYLLAVALIYGAPVIIIGIWYGARRKKRAMVFKFLFMAVPLAPLVLMLLLRTGVMTQLIGMEWQRSRVENYLGDSTLTAAIEGAYIGTVRREGLDYRHYQFFSLDGRDDRMLEVLVPPDDVHSVGYIRLTDQFAPGEAKALMLLWPSRIETNPAVATDRFFREHFPGLQPDGFGPHLLVIGLRPRRSIIVHPEMAGGNWQWREALLDLREP